MEILSRIITILVALACIFLAGTVVVDASAREGVLFPTVWLGLIALLGIGILWLIRVVANQLLITLTEPRKVPIAIAASILLLLISTVAIAAGLYSFDVWAAILYTAVPMMVGVPMINALSRVFPTRARRRSTERVVIGQIATVIRQNLPLSLALQLAAESEHGPASRCLLRISRLTGQGLPLSEAIRQGYPDCSSLILSLIVAGEKAGQLAGAMEQAEQHLLSQAARRPLSDVSVLAYGSFVGTTTLLVAIGVMVAVVPKFKEILKDFETEMPQMTRRLVEVMEWWAWHGALIVVLLLLIALVVYLRVRPRHVPQPDLCSRFADWIRWHTPGLRRLEFAQGMSAMLHMILLGVRAGMGLSPAALLAGELDVNWQLRPRMRRFAALVNQGSDLRDAAREAQLGDVTAMALAAGQRTGDMHAALRYAADYHGAIVGRLWTLINTLAWPVMTLVVGSVVAFVVLALFTPLVALINSAAAWGALPRGH